ncbi:MAG: response regulator [gamma proteobacterium symbiont of Taylorina sp.]|nr:response regulator [gamma proteobacterium symbiont of Taylorina sp.]
MKNKPLILIVDDEVINLRVIANLLEMTYDIAISTTGERAIELAQQNPQPVLILLDIMMPDMDGYEVCRQLKKSPLSAQIPVIFLTAKGEDKDEAKGLEMGAVDFITKPFRPLVDLKRIKTHIKLHQDKNLLLDQFVDTLPFATFVVDKDLSIESYNYLSQQLLDDAQSHFILRNNKLVYSRQASLLADLINNIHNTNNDAPSAGILHIIKSPTQNYRIFITPLNDEKHNQDDSPDKATYQYAIHINKYKNVLQVETQLKKIYDLTAAEARLANNIINGMTLEEIAEQGDLKYSTLKSYLKIIFQKTGTKKQHELVSAILRNFTCTI